MRIYFKLIVLFAFALSISISSSNTYAQDNNKFTEISNFTRVISESYIDSYFNMNFDRMSEFMHEEFNFMDPTASLVFGWTNPMGIDSAVNFFKTNYSSLLEMKPKFIRKIFSGETAVFEMDLDFSFNVKEGKINITMPLITILTIKDKKVIEHRDYGDYNIYLKQFSEQVDNLKK